MSDFRHLMRSNGSRSGNRALSIWNRICDEADRGEAVWVARLRQMGVKAAHPDDGWVNRDEDWAILCYPQFNDGLDIGDLLALGRWNIRTRIVRVTSWRPNRMDPFNPDGPWYWHFDPVGYFGMEVPV